MISGWRGKGVGLHDAIRRATERTQVNAVLHVVLLQLGQDVFSIRVLPQGGDVGSDLCEKQTQMVDTQYISTSNSVSYNIF